MNFQSQTLLASALAWLILWIEHWFPWRMLLRRDLHPVARYVLGVLGFTAPLSLLFAGAFGETPGDGFSYLLALWLVIVASGFSVVLAYVIDGGLTWLIQLREAKENYLSQLPEHHNCRCMVIPKEDVLNERQRSADD